MDDFVLSVKQIGSYPQGTPGVADAFLFQAGGLGGAYQWTNAAGLLAPLINAPVTFGSLSMTGALTWLGSGVTLSGSTGMLSALNNGTAFFTANAATLWASGDVTLPTGTVHLGRFPTDPMDAVPAQYMVNNTVASFNGRTGTVNLQLSDITLAGGAPIFSPNFTGTPTAPYIADLTQDDWQIANTMFVQQVVLGRINQMLAGQPLVFSLNGRSGNVTLTADDISAATFAGPDVPTTPDPLASDYSQQIANTRWVTWQVDDLQQQITDLENSMVDPTGYAPLNSPAFSGVPTAPTANPGSSTGQLATTAFVQHAVTASTTGVSSFNTRTGAVVLQGTDIVGAGGALLASPAFTGTPTVPTAINGTNSTQAASCAFVLAEIAALTAGVSSFNTRTGAVTLSLADITGAGGAPLSSPALIGTPTAPTAASTDSSTAIATTAFVHALIASVSGVTSFNARTGAVTLQGNDISAAGGALVASPTFTGMPAAPTAVPGTNTTQLATTAFVAAALTAGSVLSFNTRTGAVVLQSSDVANAGGALLTSPNFSGVPTAPTATAGTNTQQLATTAFVMAALGGGVVSTFNGRQGAVTLVATDITSAGGALLSGPAFTGVPTAPTAAIGNSTTQLATTAFVANAVAGAVTSFNSRTGAITLQANDISAAGGALLASPIFTGTPQAPTATNGTATTQLATCQFVLNELGTLGGVTSFNSRAGSVTLLPADVSSANGVIASAAQSFTAAQGAQARQNIWAAPLDALAFNGLQVNAGFEVNQPYPSPAPGPNTAGTYFCDGWQLEFAGTMGMAAISTALAGYPSAPGGFSWTGYSSVQTPEAAMAAGDMAFFRQAIEGTRISRLGWGSTNAQPATLVFWSAHHRTGLYSGSIKNGDSTRSYVFTYTQAAADIYQYNVIAIPGDQAGTWKTDNTVGLQISLTMASGATYTTATPNTWLAGNAIAATGQVNAVAATTDVFRVTGVVLLPTNEAPAAAQSALLLRPFGDELRLCQRYYCKSWPLNTPLTTAPTTQYLVTCYANNTLAVQSIAYPVTMRTLPTITLYPPAFVNGDTPAPGYWQYFNSVVQAYYNCGAQSLSGNESSLQMTMSANGVTQAANAGQAFFARGGWTGDCRFA